MASFDQYGNPTTPSFTQTPSQTGQRAPQQNQQNGFLAGDQRGANMGGGDANPFQTNYNSGGATPSQPAAQQSQQQNFFQPIDFQQTTPDFSASTYTPGQLPQTDYSVYDPHLLDLSGTNNLQQQVIQRVLNQGGSLNDSVQAQMQGQLKDQALAMQASNDAATRQGFANRGYMGGGQELAQLAQSKLGTQSSLLDQYRNLGVNAAQTNRNDILNALGMSNTIQTGQTNNNATQEGLRQSGVQSQNAATQFAFQRALEAEHLKAQAAQIGSQNALAQAQLGAQQNMSRAQMALQQQLGLGNLGLGYSQLNNNVQQNALNTALGLTQ